jgi:hypothetical protein
MTRQRAPVALIGILVFSYAAWRTAGLIAAVLILGAGYWASLRLHPRIACRTCKGAGRFYGAVYTWVWRTCHACLGRGSKIRFGAARWGTARMQGEAARITVAKRGSTRGRWTE